MHQAVLGFAALLMSGCSAYQTADSSASLPTAPYSVTLAAGDLAWSIDHDFGESHLFTQTLSSDGEGTVERVLAYMPGLTDGPGPSHMCGAAVLRIECSYSAAQLTWTLEPYVYRNEQESSWSTADRSPAFACGDEVWPVVFGYRGSTHVITIEAPPGTVGDFNYTLEARTHPCP